MNFLFSSLIVTANMGQANCVNLCGQRAQLQTIQLESLMNNQSDEPTSSFAKKVKQHIELNPKTKEIYLSYRMPHDAERQGVKMELYYLYQYSAYYEGEWKKGLPHGFGRIIYDDGSMYEGCFNKGIAHCDKALFIRKDSSCYRGQIRKNKANGQGELTTPSCCIKGKFQNDLPHGKARETYSPASYFEGDFVNGTKQGDGYYRWSSEEYYRGKFKNNMMEGKGLLQTNEYVYEGQFLDSQKKGEGQYFDKKSKFKFVGSFSKNQPLGKGKITYEDGALFIGIFDGFETRKGTLSLKSGKSIPIDVSQPQQSAQIVLVARKNKIAVH